ncbi:MAG: response regulator [Deltaproteobacteria bacterium]|jgi:putative two-component system response regulator|nr:response regulator [Deltaproteobacteria bacterium]
MSRILIVDDNLATLRSIGAQLGDRFEVRLAKSSRQALAMAESQRPDLVLLEIELQDLDGFQTMNLMRKRPALARVPVIFLSASRDPEMESRALAQGAVDFISKPVERRLLRNRLDLHLRLSAYQAGLEHTIRDLEDVIVTSFSELVECRDEHTGGHVQRTKTYTKVLGQAILDRDVYPGQLDPRRLDLLSRAAPLHDIGKIGISDLLLMKRGKLTAEEYETVKLHTTIGADVLRSIYESTPTQTYLRFAIAIAEGHHERFDGQGYPHGQAGLEIDLSNRIMSVVNVYDSLVTDRSYRPAFSHEKAIELVLAGRGTEFDPAIIDVFKEVCHQFGAVKDLTFR